MAIGGSHRLFIPILKREPIDKSGRIVCSIVMYGHGSNMGHFKIVKFFTAPCDRKLKMCARGTSNGQKLQKSDHARAHHRRGWTSPARCIDPPHWGDQPHALCPSSPLLSRRGRRRQVELLAASEAVADAPDEGGARSREEADDEAADARRSGSR